MGQHAIFSATLGLCHPWKIVTMTFSRDENRLDITIDFYRSITCPSCRKEYGECLAQTETWCHDNFLNYTTYLHALVPNTACPECTIAMVERPWTRKGSKFVRIEEWKASAGTTATGD